MRGQSGWAAEMESKACLVSLSNSIRTLPFSRILSRVREGDKARNQRTPGRAGGVRGGGGMEIQINGDPKEIAAFVVGLQERHKKEVSLSAAICQAAAEGEAVRLQGDRVGRNFQESG